VKNRLALILLTGFGVLGGAAALFWSLRPAPDTPAPSPAAETRPAAPAPPVAAASPAVKKPAAVAPPKTTPSPTPEADKAPATGTLIIESDVPETSVFIDRVYLGTAPVTVPNLTPGPHRLNMSVTGYEGISETIEVEPGTRTIAIKFKEIRLDEQIGVTHKHGLGSCRGTLRATPQSLAYDTTNAGDAFRVALTDLEAFEVDYLEKNLRVKVRKGKTYNFADADNNIDRLYLFHQTVEKVRQRLLAGKRP
jgi:hypothetical protein